ncbi:MAG: cysteine--tRNA ligase [Candidatus Yonathbacteria bacterium RIFCSPLOWO2_01_FULL_47_33b]|uniref:Cysteine--tRNA ligase n=1 Tax=Candidatus Yonathbacteria bacterium RIFCSPLOWO2_01_FULL_47_33b TaxID=1802727 RepID=A0A1G2SGH0_9BACT|nr:MAG: cysteine--tRNA ligase [Candidatus Yonathbacteria bacterium RIFCSPLOWO2_01_FULL_47_33b]
MDLRLFNTLTGATENLVPLHDREVRMYHCGPTVYGYAHIGNLRSFIANDILRRTLEYAGYTVKQVMNITDIDDKMIKKSADEGVPLSEIANRYEDVLMADLRHLNIKIPEHIPRATEHIGGMIVLIEKLLREGYAYPASDGIYFEVAKSKDYGALARLDLNAETESRVEGAADKKSPRDFALWKFWTAEDGENVFDASFGRGRPGWHIECSAMAMSELGETLDIHTGGVDLIFPHHTNEIAQSEAATGKPFVKQWVHTEFVMVDGQKMSKSLNNMFTLKEIVEKGISPAAFRYWVLGAHYRAKANFTWEGLQGAQTALVRLAEHLGAEVGTVNEDYQRRFEELVTDDLDTPRALALAWEVAKDTSLSSADKTATLLDFDRVLGLGFVPHVDVVIPNDIKELILSRETARTTKNWAESDRIRDEINALGWDVLDTDKGTEVQKKN